MDAMKALAMNPLDATRAKEISFTPLDGERGGTDGELSEALKDFEALFVNQLLQVMRRSVPEGDPGLRSPGTQLYRQMLDEEMSRLIAHSGKGLGLAEMLQQQLGKEAALD